ncbi:SDR family NAD(P)-dependent oxidoreductase [Jannaschia seohaensis]|uniref:3-oxoacyl-[acyl-carrier protein] reductase n=1 Tax=Jannaschia seohaensis TaxID=475081 RepID=A0A2Y9BAJ0_9RHOB|nr:SDR family NAD(P)-dependent oxidoreductase [Jannaschia seohaensis]PWJ11753.1 3-oxoacyl-[acyl-carrier protein] reductase [Jannaschia seohaensis]SSA51269.1 3-oxoacyl-[acyl-carrier protein] reductase [Jannaschia seohaensis]
MDAGQTAVLTGAAGAIGQMTARRLLDQGATVIGVDRDASGLAGLASTFGDAFVPLVADLSDEAGISECSDRITGDHGSIAILINNVGVISHSKFLETSLADLRHAMTVNFESAYLMSQNLLPGMVRAKHGRIINVSSFAGRSGGLLAGTAYSLSKSAMIGLTFALAREFGPKGVSVNAVAPAFVQSDMMSSSFKRPEDKDRLLASIPLGRLCDPDEVASAIAYLASAPAGFINGEVIDINGGVQCD